MHRPLLGTIRTLASVSGVLKNAIEWPRITDGRLPGKGSCLPSFNLALGLKDVMLILEAGVAAASTSCRCPPGHRTPTHGIG